MSLRLTDVVVEIGTARLLDGVDLHVPAGRIVAVVGPNGAGKTTLLDAITGVVRLQGTVEIGGNGAGVGRVFQGSPLPATLTVGEVASLAAHSREAAQRLMDRFGLGPHASSFVAELSTGMRRILDLAVATADDPPVLLLDEPSSGLAAAEVERLAELLLGWKDSTGAAILIVEHDAPLVTKVADEVVMLSEGRVVDRGPAAEVLSRKPPTPVRVRDPGDPAVREALHRVATNAVPATPPLRRSRSTWTLLRLGLWQFAAGLMSVMLLGVLNRIMKVELGISLALVAPVLACYNLAAPLALAIGHRSDTHPVMGRRRAPYILAGAVVSGLGVAAAPHVARFMADGISVFSLALAIGLFAALGVGLYCSSAVFFALLADLTTPAERGYASAVVYLELMAGILVGVALTVSILDDEASGLNTLFAIAGAAVVCLAVVAVWGQERKVAARPVVPDRPDRFVTVLKEVVAIRQVRGFFAFMTLVTFFLFLYQMVVEPFGGDVLGLTVRQTSAFNAMLTLGILIGMVVAGRSLADRYGHKRVATVGLACAAVGFGFLALAALAQSNPPTWLALFAVGLAIGIGNVGLLAMMMGMIDPRRTALFMGGWTLAHALAVGLANATSGVLYEVFQVVLGTPARGYAAVFALQAVGMAVCLPMLRGIDPEKFRAGIQERPAA